MGLRSILFLMTARHLLQQNGDFKESPLITTVRRIHQVFSSRRMNYAVVGGMAVVRNGAVRTTVDVDVLVVRDDWEAIRNDVPEGFQVHLDHALDTETSVQIDVLFPGDDWEMLIPVPEPDSVRVFDEEIGAFYIDLLPLIGWKTAVYMKKRKEDGIEIAAKDLADIVALTENNIELIGKKFIDSIHPAVRKEYRGIAEAVRKKINART